MFSVSWVLLFKSSCVLLFVSCVSATVSCVMFSVDCVRCSSIFCLFTLGIGIPLSSAFAIAFSINFCIASANVWVIAVVVAFFLIWYPAAIRYEDAKLERLFGDDWREWSKGTWAIFPNRLNFAKLTDTQWGAHQSLIRNGELWITIYLVACAAWLWYGAPHQSVDDIERNGLFQTLQGKYDEGEEMSSSQQTPI